MGTTVYKRTQLNVNLNWRIVWLGMSRVVVRILGVAIGMIRGRQTLMRRLRNLKKSYLVSVAREVATVVQALKAFYRLDLLCLGLSGVCWASIRLTQQRKLLCFALENMIRPRQKDCIGILHFLTQ